MVIEIAPDMGVDRGGIARVDAVEAGVVVGRLAGIVIVAAGIAGVETADGEAPVPQKLLVEARRRDAEVRLLQELFRQPREARKLRSEEHTSELQSLMRISYAVFCLKKKHKINKQPTTQPK